MTDPQPTGFLTDEDEVDTPAPRHSDRPAVLLPSSIEPRHAAPTPRPRPATKPLALGPIVIFAVEVVAATALAFVSLFGWLAGLLATAAVALAGCGGVLFAQRVRRLGWRGAFRRSGGRLGGRLGGGRSPLAPATRGGLRSKLPRILGGTRPRSPFSPASRARAWLGFGGPASRRRNPLTAGTSRGHGRGRTGGGGGLLPAGRRSASPPAAIRAGNRPGSPGLPKRPAIAGGHRATPTTAAGPRSATVGQPATPAHQAPATRRDQPAEEQQSAMTSPQPQPAAAGSSRPVNGDDEQSFYTWGRSLPGYAAAVAEFAAPFRKLAEQARDHQPASPVLAEKVEHLASLLGQAEAVAAELGPTWKSHHDADIDRVEQPRKGPAVEQRADVGLAYRQM